jgi:hypothetical protein
MRRAQAYARSANAHLKPVRQSPDGSDERKRKSGNPSFTLIAILAKKYFSITNFGSSNNLVGNNASL